RTSQWKRETAGSRSCRSFDGCEPIEKAADSTRRCCSALPGSVNASSNPPRDAAPELEPEDSEVCVDPSTVAPPSVGCFVTMFTLSPLPQPGVEAGAHVRDPAVVAGQAAAGGAGHRQRAGVVAAIPHRLGANEVGLCGEEPVAGDALRRQLRLG